MKTTLRNFLLVSVTAAALMLVPAVGTAAPEPPPIAGKWSGRVLLDNDSFGYKVRIKRKLTKGKVGGYFYQTLGECLGELIYMRRKGKSYYFREKVTTGRLRCPSGSVDRLKRVGKKKVSFQSKGPKANPGTTVGTLRPFKQP